MNVPTQFKSVKKYFREAKKFDNVSPTISYYCRMYGVTQAMQIDKTSPEAMQFIGGMMDQMESLKKSEKWENLEKDDERVKIETMALQVFAAADKTDRAGEATKKTAQAFNTAFVLMDVLKHFGDRDVEIDTKAKYALFKTGDILRAFKEGRKPQPGPPAGEDDPNEPMGGGGEPVPMGGPPDGGFADITIEPAAPEPSIPSSGGWGAPAAAPPKPAAPAAFHAAPVAPAAAPRTIASKTYESQVLACAAGEDIMKHAFSAMRFNDVKGACAKLREALAILAPYEGGDSVTI